MEAKYHAIEAMRRKCWTQALTWTWTLRVEAPAVGKKVGGADGGGDGAAE